VVGAGLLIEPFADIVLCRRPTEVGELLAATLAALLALPTVAALGLVVLAFPLVLIVAVLVVLLVLVVVLLGAVGLRLQAGLSGASPALPEGQQLGRVQERLLLNPEPRVDLEDMVDEARQHRGHLVARQVS